MDALELIHVIGSVAGLGVALYVGKSMAQLKLAILESVKKEYVSKEMMSAIDKHQWERHEYNKQALEELKEGNQIIHRRLDELFNRRRSDREPRV